jgi:hypothetical protein
MSIKFGNSRLHETAIVAFHNSVDSLEKENKLNFCSSHTLTLRSPMMQLWYQLSRHSEEDMIHTVLELRESRFISQCFIHYQCMAYITIYRRSLTLCMHYAWWQLENNRNVTEQLPALIIGHSNRITRKWVGK